MTNRLLRYLLHAIALAIILLGVVLPIVMIPFVNVMPYLHTVVFTDRLILSFLALILCTIFLWLGAAPTNRRGVKSVLATWKDAGTAIVGLVFAAYLAAALSANLLGTLVRIFPGDPYSTKVEVVSAKSLGSKKKSVDLGVKTYGEGRVYYLTIAKELFDYHQFRVGDALILYGKRNFFGSYVDEYEQNGSKVSADKWCGFRANCS